MPRGGKVATGVNVVPAPLDGAYRTRIVPEWVKDLRGEGSAKAEAGRLGRGARSSGVTYWRLRLRMFSPHSIFSNELLWAALRESIENALSPWAANHWTSLYHDVCEDFGHVPEGTMRHALRMLVEDGVITFEAHGQRDGEYGFGGYLRPARPIRRKPVRLDFDYEDRITPREQRRADRASAACR